MEIQAHTYPKKFPKMPVTSGHFIAVTISGLEILHVVTVSGIETLYVVTVSGLETLYVITVSWIETLSAITIVTA
jgi:hypothetical protein